MRQGCWIVMVLLVLGLMVAAAGCGNVSVQGDAMTALETSTLDAYGFLERVQADPNAVKLARTHEFAAELQELVGEDDHVVGIPAYAAAHVEEDAGHEGQDGAELVGDAFGGVVVAHVDSEEFFVRRSVAQIELVGADDEGLGPDAE